MAEAMRYAVRTRHSSWAVLPWPARLPMALELTPLPVGSVFLVASESAGPDSPAFSMAALSGWPSPLRITLHMCTSCLVVA